MKNLVILLISCLFFSCKSIKHENNAYKIEFNNKKELNVLGHFVDGECLYYTKNEKNWKRKCDSDTIIVKIKK